MKALSLVLAAALSVCSTEAMEVAASPESVRPLTAGSQAPTATIGGLGGESVELSTLFAAKPTVLIFFRGGWCPFCNRHLASLATLELGLRRLGYQIVAISPDPLPVLQSTAARQHLRYRLLSDRDLRVSGNYKVAYRISAADEKDYEGNGIHLPLIPGATDFWLPIPTAFIVGRDGLIKFAYIQCRSVGDDSPGRASSGVKGCGRERQLIPVKTNLHV
jgi:peroxiredoxin